MPSHSTLCELVILASSGCNQRCSYCWIRPGERESPRWHAVAAATEELLASSERRVRVSFTGGEPLLAFPLIRTTVKYAESHRRPDQEVRFKLATNGLLIDGRVLSFLVKHDFDVQISLDGGREVQERRSPGSFDRLDDLFAMLRRHQPRYLEAHVSVAATITPATVRYLSDSVSQLMATGAGTIGISPASGADAGSASATDMAELDRQLEMVSREAFLHYSRTKRIPLAPFRNAFPSIGPRRSSPWFCAAPMNRSLTIDADGARAACVVATRTYAPAPPRTLRPAVNALRRLAAHDSADDPGRNDIAELELFRWDAKRYSSYGSCATCRWKNECRICPLSAVAERDWPDVRRVPDFLCGFTRLLLKHRQGFPPSGLVLKT